jgi:LysR family glycine cleavage system transcriptional activator
MDWTDLPPLAGLRAFAAFAHSGGLLEASKALGVSHAAISQQLKALEKHLGVKLLDRSGRAMVLTGDGHQLAQATQQGFEQMISACQGITGANDARPLHVSTSPGFTGSWLMPRLAEFRAAHPEIDILIDPSVKLVALSPGGVDLAIRYGIGPWPDVESTMLVETPIVVVAAPSLLKGRVINGAEDLKSLPWLEELGRSEGTNWLKQQGVSSELRGGFIQVPGNLLMDAARDGLGVAVMALSSAERDIQAGRLVQLSVSDNKGEGYHIVTRPGVQRPPLRAFVRWLKRCSNEEY